jgi:hypothetical protein
MEQEKKKLNCEKCLCRLCFDNEAGTCMNCKRCKENGGANQVRCLMDCKFVGRES